MNEKSEKIALVTGASRGLGAALAVALAPTHHILAVARTTGALEELDDRIQAVGGSATLAPLDITNDGAMQHLCRSIHDRWGVLDLWVHCAIHGAPLSPAAHLDDTDFDKCIAINTKAAQRLITYVSPLLLAAGDGIAVFFDDPAAQGKFYGNYGTSKAAQMALVRSWQAETVRTGPKVKILSPKPMPTGLRARFYPGENRAALARPTDEARRLLPEIL
ncbi:MAG: SDR family NAD(P)-dependent oxidoreductase [Halocynthiibacter sp.]